MRSDAGETERLPFWAWSHRRRTCQREKQFPALPPEVWVARAIQPNPGVEPGKNVNAWPCRVDSVTDRGNQRQGGQECPLLISWSVREGNGRVTKPRVRPCNPARRSVASARVSTHKRRKSRTRHCGKSPASG